VGWLRRPRLRASSMGRATGWTRRPSLVGALMVVAITGGIVIGMPRWARFPGGYLVSGDTRAIQPESHVASQWLLRTYGPGRRVVGDLTNGLVMGSYGRQAIVQGLSFVYFGDSFGADKLGALRRAEVEFIVVDQRLTTDLPIGGYYFESGEPDAGRHEKPLPLEVLERFDQVPELRRVYDGGSIRIYRLEGSAQP
jgi:hypothetical protein